MLVSTVQWRKSAARVHCLLLHDPPPHHIPPLQVITEHQAELPVLYNKSSLITYFTHRELWISISFLNNWAPLVVQIVKNPPALQDTWVRSLSQEDPQEEEIATHSNILAWRIPWMEEPGRLQSMGLQRVRHDFHNHRTVLNSPKSFNYRFLSALLNVSST